MFLICSKWAMDVLFEPGTIVYPPAELASRDSAGNFSNRLGLLDRKIQCKSPGGEAPKKILHSKKLTFLAKVSSNEPTPNKPQPTESHLTHPSQSHYWILHTDARYGVVSLVAITTMFRSLVTHSNRIISSQFFGPNFPWKYVLKPPK